MAQFHPPPLRGTTSKIRGAGYMQLRYTGTEDIEDRLSLRRLKLMVGGELNRDFQWYAQAFFKYNNSSPTDGRVYFQEGWLRFRRYRQFQIVAGQIKPNFGRERFTPDFELYTINRSLVVRTLIPSGEFGESFARDIGVQVDGKLERRFQYAVGLFGGNGANRPIHGIGPMVTARSTVDVVPGWNVAGKPLTVNAGGAYSIRKAKDISFGSQAAAQTRALLEDFRGTDQRAALELEAEWGGWSLRTEYIRATFDSAGPPAADVTADGYYGEVGKFLSPKWQTVAKLEGFDPNKRLRNSKDIRWFTLGLNYYIRGDHRLKLMTNYVFRWERVQARPSNMVLIQFQWIFL